MALNGHFNSRLQTKQECSICCFLGFFFFVLALIAKSLRVDWISRTDTRNVKPQQTASLAQRVLLTAGNNSFDVTHLYLNTCKGKPHILWRIIAVWYQPPPPPPIQATLTPHHCRNCAFLPQHCLFHFMMHLKLTLRWIYHFHAVAQGHKMESQYTCPLEWEDAEGPSQIFSTWRFSLSAMLFG